MLSLREGKDTHGFISYVWATGSDQVAMIKSRLTSIMPPGLRIFLDVDDLNEVTEVPMRYAARGVRQAAVHVAKHACARLHVVPGFESSAHDSICVHPRCRVRQTALLIAFFSKGYFQSHGCLRELRTAIEAQVPSRSTSLESLPAQ